MSAGSGSYQGADGPVIPRPKGPGASFTVTRERLDDLFRQVANNARATTRGPDIFYNYEYTIDELVSAALHAVDTGPQGA